MTWRDTPKAVLYAKPYQAPLAGTLLVSGYVLACFTPILSAVGGLRWFEVAGVALSAFWLNGRQFSFRAATPFLLVAGLVVMGACLGLLRAEDPKQAAWNAA